MASLATAALSLMLSGCGAWQSVVDSSSNAYHAVFYKQIKTLNVDVTARASVNPDEAGRPCSVAVRIYQLKDRKLFDGASYDSLLKNDKTLLAGELTASSGVVLNPGAATSLSEPMRRDTQYVAIVAFYREPGTDLAWRRVVPKQALSADEPLKIELVDRGFVATDNDNTQSAAH
jgi:type VI secretion system protein VasD